MNNTIEWEIGHHSPPVTVQDGDDEFRVIHWFVHRQPEMKIICLNLVRDGEALDIRRMCERAERQPLDCAPGKPSRIRCDDEHIAAVVAELYPKARVQIGGTPYLSQVFADLDERVKHTSSVKVEKYAVTEEDIRRAGLDPNNLELTQENQDKLAEFFISDFYRTEWLDLPIPALDGLSPREATRTKEGTKALHQLLLWMEGRTKDMIEPLRVDIREICELLGIDEPDRSGED
jgi:hypothetical protein